LSLRYDIDAFNRGERSGESCLLREASVAQTSYVSHPRNEKTPKEFVFAFDVRVMRLE
jgi:hypothetical protein